MHTKRQVTDQRAEELLAAGELGRAMSVLTQKEGPTRFDEMATTAMGEALLSQRDDDVVQQPLDTK